MCLPYSQCLQLHNVTVLYSLSHTLYINYYLGCDTAGVSVFVPQCLGSIVGKEEILVRFISNLFIYSYSYFTLSLQVI